MPKIKIEDLDRISKETRKAMLLREGTGKAKITVHMGTCGISVPICHKTELIADLREDPVPTTSPT